MLIKLCGEYSDVGLIDVY
uniref:Uncharacterized protein n=1 Tax=Rhizophora mucronata TaxID=61149 RepID=A0A2P2P7W6_RHIMU